MQAPSDDPAARTVLHDEIEREVFDKELGVMFEALLVESMQHGVADPAGGGAGAQCQSLAPVDSVPGERPPIDLSILGP